MHPSVNIYYINRTKDLRNVFITENAPHNRERHFAAVRKGLEPSTSGVTGRHSNQLNYRTRLVAYS